MSERPALFLGAGLVVFLSANAAAISFAIRRLSGQQGRRTRPAPFAAGALAGVGVFVVTASTSTS